MEPGSKVPQYFFNSKWHEVYFSDQEQPPQYKGYLKFLSTETKPVPEYYIHFTIARFEHGRYNTLEYDFNKKINDFEEELPLTPGNYMLVTGNRLNDSKILTRISFFDISGNEHKTIEVKLRKEISSDTISGKIDLKNIVSFFDKNKIRGERIIDKGVVFLWIEPDKEPTMHILNDMPLLQNELDSWGGYFLFLSDSIQKGNRFNPEGLKGLPANSLFGIDYQLGALKKILMNNTVSEIRLPYVVLADRNDNIQYTSTGYRIGIGQQILKHIRYR